MFKYKIIDIEETGEDAKIFRMRPETGGPILEHKPGVFAMVHLLDEKGDSLDKRPYSIASAPGAKDLEFCIKMVGGKFTSKLDKLKAGDVVGIEGPMGNFTYQGKKCIFICGGSGIAPIMSMLRDIGGNKKDGVYFAFISSRTRNALVYYDELRGLEAGNPALRVIFTLTREEPKDWEGRCGRIGDAMIKDYVKEPAEFSWYLCGPMKMVLALKECIVSMGADEAKVHFEGWG